MMRGKTYKDLLRWTIEAMEVIGKHNADKDAIQKWSLENGKADNILGTAD